MALPAVMGLERPKMTRLARFERSVLPHLDAAYNLARWLTRNDQDAEDVVQEAFVRALRFFDALRDSNARPWLLAIVRNCGYTWRRGTRTQRESVSYVEDEHGGGGESHRATDAAAIESSERAELRDALDQLPIEYREAIVLREIEGLSYKEIASVTGTPIGTVMSRLSRARRRLQEALGLGVRAEETT